MGARSSARTATMPARNIATPITLDSMLYIFYIRSVTSPMEVRMSFREKVAWIALIGIVGAASFYFGMLLRYPGPSSRAHFIGLFVAATLLQTVVTTVATIVVTLFSLKDASAPRDERVRRIASRAVALTYFLLLFGVILSAVSIHFGNGTFGMLNTQHNKNKAAEA